MPFTSTTNIKMYYELKGAGERVLFISGTGGDLRVKPNVLDGPLAGANQVLAFDQRGLGQTEKPELSYTMEDYADDAAALMDELGWPSAHVIGVSFGGMVALNLALRHPAKINKLVLCCTSPGGPAMASFPLHELPDNLSDSDRIRKMLAVNDVRQTEEWQQQHATRVDKMIKVSLEMRPADHQTPAFKAGAKRQLEARSHHDVVDHLPGIQKPTLICAGKYDGMAPPENQESMRDMIPGAELAWFEGGHLFLIQDKNAWPKITSFLNHE